MGFLDLFKIIGIGAPLIAAWASLKSRNHEQKRFEVEQKELLLDRCAPIFSGLAPNSEEKAKIESAFHSYSGVEASYELIQPIIHHHNRFELLKRLRKAQDQFKFDPKSQEIKRTKGSAFLDTVLLGFSMSIYILFSFVFCYQLSFGLPKTIELIEIGKEYLHNAFNVGASIALFTFGLYFWTATVRTVISRIKIEKAYFPDSFEKHPLVRTITAFDKLKSKLPLLNEK